MQTSTNYKTGTSSVSSWQAAACTTNYAIICEQPASVYACDPAPPEPPEPPASPFCECNCCWDVPYVFALRMHPSHNPWQWLTASVCATLQACQPRTTPPTALTTRAAATCGCRPGQASTLWPASAQQQGATWLAMATRPSSCRWESLAARIS